MARIAASFSLLVLLSLSGCVAGPGLSASQWESLETSTVEVPIARAFQCVAQAMLDRGFVILVSDSSAGLLRGARMSAPPYTSVAAEDTETRPGLNTLWLSEIVAYVRAEAPQRTRLRLQVRERGVRIADPDAVRAWSVDVERRALSPGAPLTRDSVPAEGAR